MRKPLLVLILPAAAWFAWAEFGGKGGLPTTGSGGTGPSAPSSGAGGIVSGGAGKAAGGILD